MKKEDEILKRFGNDPGFRVPDGYFADFTKKMAESLPEKTFVPKKKAGMWLRIRPYVYMAAMFAGVWCMMYLFNDLKNRAGYKDNPDALAERVMDEEFFQDLKNANYISDEDILKDLYNDSISAEDFESDSAIN